MRRLFLSFLIIAGMFVHSKAQLSIDFQYVMPLCWGSNTGFITAVVTGGSGSYTYVWSTGHTTALCDSVPGGLYSVTVSDVGLGTSATAEFLLHSPSPMTVHTVLTHNPCYGGAIGTALVQTQGGSGGYLYNWISPIPLIGAFVTDLPADNYTVVVSDTNGCSVSQSFEITQMHHEAIRPIVEVTPVSCRDGLNDGAVLVNEVFNVTGAPSFVWESIPFTEMSADSLFSGLYNLSVIDENMCQADFVIEVPFLDVPCVIIYNGFSPNGDGYNDVWEIDNIFLFPEAMVRLWNVDGKLIYESEPGYPVPFNGMFKDKLLPSSTLYYEVNLGTNVYKPYTGYVRIEY
jgi:gliding motility-associated-like protein